MWQISSMCTFVRSRNNFLLPFAWPGCSLTVFGIRKEVDYRVPHALANLLHDTLQNLLLVACLSFPMRRQKVLTGECWVATRKSKLWGPGFMPGPAAHTRAPARSQLCPAARRPAAPNVPSCWWPGLHSCGRGAAPPSWAVEADILDLAFACCDSAASGN